MIQGEDITAPKTGSEHVMQELLIYKAYLYPYSMHESEENIKSISQSPWAIESSLCSGLNKASTHTRTLFGPKTKAKKKKAFYFGPLKSEDCSQKDQSVYVCFSSFCI